MTVNDLTNEFVSINRGVPQGTVLGPVLFSVMVNDIIPVHLEPNLLVKYPGDITLSVPVSENQDCSSVEVIFFNNWATENRRKLNLTKTLEIVGRIRTAA